VGKVDIATHQAVEKAETEGSASEVDSRADEEGGGGSWNELYNQGLNQGTARQNLILIFRRQESHLLRKRDDIAS